MERKSYAAIQKPKPEIGKKHFLIQINCKISFMCFFLLTGLIILFKIILFETNNYNTPMSLKISDFNCVLKWRSRISD